MKRIFFPLLCCLLLVLGLGSTVGWAQEKEDYALLIVGDEADAEMYGREKVLIQEMAKNFSKKQKIPIYSYHFNKDRERVYCEKKLNILREDLLFVGIVSLSPKDHVPRKVVYRIDRIVTPARAATDVVTRADELTGATPVETATPEAEPSPVASPAAPNPADANGWRVQLGSFTVQKGAQDLVDRLKTKGYDAKVDKTQTGEVAQWKVWVGTFKTKDDAGQAQNELKNDGFKEGYVVEAGK